MIIKDTYEVEISEIEVDSRYYSFYYIVKKNGKVIAANEYQNDHAWEGEEDYFKETLIEGEASKIALEEID